MEPVNLLYGQSGGPTAVINASMYGVLIQAFKSPKINKVFGAINGVEGILKENFCEMTPSEDLKKLLYTPGCALGSVRHKLKDEELELIRQIFAKHRIGYFLYNGGNDSMDTCHRIDQYFSSVGFPCKVIGIPKTIDNDLPHTDHTPGYGSAAKYIATSLLEINKDIEVYPKGRLTIVEVMGRDTGWLAASAGVTHALTGKPDLVYIPEVAFDLEDFLKRVSQIYATQQKVLVVVSEGIKDANGNFIGVSAHKDVFGHQALGGVASYLCAIVKERLKIKCRFIELNLLQRCAAHLASLSDVEEAKLCGMSAVMFAEQGKTGEMVTMIRQEGEIIYSSIPLGKVANQIKYLDTTYYDFERKQIKPDFLDYILPLIKGENTIVYQDGTPDFYERKKL